jgi:protein-S-isoprenylcysteine O-methyltransferase Ste14
MKSKQKGVIMFVFVRSAIYAVVFISLVLIYLPGRFLSWFGFIRPAAFEAQQIIGMVLGTIGAGVAVWCILTFAAIGRGTPAPFDPPRKLVIEGPYRFVRNPMYIGAGLALIGAGIFYGSWQLLGYAVFFFLACHLFVSLYEEPALRRTFGEAYEAYCRQTSRWWPSFRRKPK